MPSTTTGVKSAMGKVPKKTNDALAYKSISNGKLDKFGKEIPKVLTPDASAQVLLYKPTGPQPRKTWKVRNEWRGKDIIVESSGATHNIAKLTSFYLGSKYSHTTKEKVHAPDYDFVQDFRNMSPATKAAFLDEKNREIEIRVQMKTIEEEKKELENRCRLGKKYKPSRTVLDTLDSLGPGFAGGAKSVTISISFLDAVVPGGNPAAPLDPTSPNFLLLEAIASWVEISCPNLKYLAIIMLLPQQTSAFRLHQLYHAVPFYTLSFKDWDLKFCPQGASDDVGPRRVPEWALRKCTEEFWRVDEEKEVLRKIAEREEREAYYVNPVMRYSDEPAPKDWTVLGLE